MDTYFVFFFDGRIYSVETDSFEKAKILMQALSIHEGKDFQVEKVLNNSTGKYYWE